MKNKPKKMDIKEFRDMGFLQEVNRLFFHPLGLALEVEIEWPEGITDVDMENYDNDVSKHPKAKWSLGGIQDYRDDPEGLLFGEGIIDEDKVSNVQSLLQKKRVIRSKLPECSDKGIQTS